MNDTEITEAVTILTRYAPELAPYAPFAAAWRDIVTAHSDGWTAWPPGRRSARGFCLLLSQSVTLLRKYPPTNPRCVLPGHDTFRRAIGPIKTCAGRYHLPFPKVIGTPAAKRRAA